MGGCLLSLVLHGPAVRLSRADADRLRTGALYPKEAGQEGRRDERLHARGTGRVHPLLHSGKPPRGVRGLPGSNRDRSRSRRSGSAPETCDAGFGVVGGAKPRQPQLQTDRVVAGTGKERPWQDTAVMALTLRATACGNLILT